MAEKTTVKTTDSEKVDEKINEEKQKILQMSEISLQLDSYDDIFSSFDPRPYSQRALSVDFLDESRRASRDKKEGVELKLLIPKYKRDVKQEGIIKRRLLEHFRRHHEMVKQETKGIMKTGLFFVVLGVILMFLATFVFFKYEKSAITSFFVILLEPASWFTFWEGLNHMIFESKRTRVELNFYRKMSKCEIIFMAH